MLRRESGSGAAVTIDLIRFAASARRAALGGFVERARTLLKSPPGTTV